MDKIVEVTILSYLPKARKIEDREKGTCKIVLPCPVKQMEEECEALKRALKDSSARPTCLKCHSHNTWFRYFDNTSSKSLQARYKCLACNQLFTFGGKKHTRHYNNNASLTIHPKGQNVLALEKASSDLVSDDSIMRGNERHCPIDFFKQEAALYQYQDLAPGHMRQHTAAKNDCLIDFFKQEALLYQYQDWAPGHMKLHTPAEDDCLIDLQLCLNCISPRFQS